MRNKYCWIGNRKGVVLFFVLMLVFMETILAGIILGIIRSNQRNAFHSISRIKAYYAINAAIIYTRAKLYTNTWGFGNYAICPTPTSPPCDTYAATNELIDFDIPYTVRIQVGNVNTGPAGTRNITMTTDFTPLL